MATVRMYSPTGNGIVVNVLDIEKRLQEGYKTEETWKAEQAVVSQQKYQEWLTSPDTLEERFRMLRAVRDAKLAEYDKHISQLDRMIRMYPNNTDYYTLRNLWDDYAIALCNLPEQEGAPWDGGGNNTPWPVIPA